jgi:hypothetical protein
VSDINKQAKLLELLENLSKQSNQSTESAREQAYDDAYIGRLKASYEAMLAQHTLSKGQLVRWKPGLKNRRLPQKNQPAIVWEILAEPIIQTDKDSGTPYFREPLDIALALLDEDGDLVIFHYDSKRFEPI